MILLFFESKSTKYFYNFDSYYSDAFNLKLNRKNLVEKKTNQTVTCPMKNVSKHKLSLQGMYCI